VNWFSIVTSDSQSLSKDRRQLVSLLSDVLLVVFVLNDSNRVKYPG